MSKRWGRRMCMFVMSIWAIVCATLVITSKTKEQILVARILNCKVSAPSLSGKALAAFFPSI